LPLSILSVVKVAISFSTKSTAHEPAWELARCRHKAAARGNGFRQRERSRQAGRYGAGARNSAEGGGQDRRDSGNAEEVRVRGFGVRVRQQGKRKSSEYCRPSEEPTGSFDNQHASGSDVVL
jgi:hypothetical protein